ncbi:PB1 domain-containing protein [Rhodotorula paludigena]|uniref:PB1 domain-containing protein n=1 Tax=Rhodotorula paludigena TaxID=86838 RepID=UPI00317FD4DD
MSTLSLKVSYSDPASGTTTLRRLALARGCPPSFAHLAADLRTRFLLAPGDQLDLLHRDQDGDLVTLSSDGELRELVQSLTPDEHTLRLELRLADRPASVATPADSIPPTAATVEADDWLEVSEARVQALAASELHSNSDADKVEVLFSTPESHPPSPPAAADPEETPLAAPASLAERTQALIDADFPSSSTIDDPADEPLPSLADVESEVPPPPPHDLPFTGLPSSFASLLSGLPTHAGSFGAHLSTLLSSPHSALGRLSTLAHDPTGALDLSDLGRSVAQLSDELFGAAREVAEGVRREADAVRGEFAQFRDEVEREKRRFGDEVNEALEQARQERARANASTTAAETAFESVASPQSEPTVAASDALGDESLHPGARSPSLSPAERQARLAQRLAKRAAKEARHIAREKRRQEKEARREERRAEKAAHRTAHRRRDVASEDGKKEEKAGASPEMAPMPGSLPVFANPAASVLEAPKCHPVRVERWCGTHYGRPIPSVSSSSSCTSVGSVFAQAPLVAEAPARLDDRDADDDDDKPVLLTKFLLGASDLGIDVEAPAVRHALTDLWCEHNGRGYSRLIERACDEWLSY